MRNWFLKAAAIPAIMMALLLGGASDAQAQGTRKDDMVLTARGLPAAGISVAVCAQPANTSTTPCSPLALLFSNAALTQALANPLTTDGLGNYNFYAAPGKYTIQIFGPTITTRVLTDVVLPPDPSTPTFTSLTTTSGISAFTLTLSGNLTVAGSASIGGSITMTNQSAPPAAPAAGSVALYTKTVDKKLYYKDDSGAETGPLLPGGSTFISVAFSATPTFTVSGNTIFAMTLAGNVTAPTFTGQTSGNIIVVQLTQDATGGRTFTWPLSFLNPPDVAIAANAVTSAAFYFDGTNWRRMNNTFPPTCGPSPWQDIRCFGGFASSTKTTGTIAAASTSLSTTAAQDFRAGQGVVVRTAGPASTLATPAAPTVAVIGGTGATAYQYQVVAEDINMGFTAASPVGTIANGLATLSGALYAQIASVSRVGGTTTITTTVAHGFTTGYRVRVSVSPDLSNAAAGYQNFGGEYTIASTPTPTTFTYAQAGTTNASIPTNSDASAIGVVTAFNGNKITWTAVTNGQHYLIYGRQAGAMNLLTVLPPGTLSYTDFGFANATNSFNTTNDPALNPYPLTPPAAATKGDLITTISSIAGTTFTLANAATSTATSVDVLHDNSIALTNAYNALVAVGQLGGGIYFPPSSSGTIYSFYANTVLPSNARFVKILLGTGLNLDATLSVNRAIEFVSLTPFATMNSFSSTPNNLISGNANPLIYVGSGGTPNSVAFTRLSFLTQTNYSSAVVVDAGTADYVFDNCDGVHNLQNNYQAPVVWVRGAFNVFITQGSYNTNAFATAPSLGMSGAWLFTGNPPQNQLPGLWYFDRTTLVGHGIIYDATGTTTSNSQNEVKNVLYESFHTPLVTVLGTGGSNAFGLRVNGGSMGDGRVLNHPAVANYASPSVFNSVVFINFQNPSGPLVGGLHTATVVGILNDVSPAQTEDTTSFSGFGASTLSSADFQVPPLRSHSLMNQPLILGNANAPFLVRMADVPKPTLALTAGGTLTVGTALFYQVVAQDVRGGETAFKTSLVGGPITPTAGNQSVVVSWTTAPGATGYIVMRSTSASSFVNAGRFAVAGGATATFTDTGAAPPFQQTAMSIVSGAGVTRADTTGLVGQQLDLVSGGFATTLKGAAAPTAARTLTARDASYTIAGTDQLPLAGATPSLGGASLAAGACTSGTVTVSGATTSMSAAASPSADPGASFLWLAFVSAANTVTVRVCNFTSAAATPAASVYNVRVIP